MNYDEAIAYWFGRINYEVRSAGPLDLKLERMRALLRLLGNPQDRLRIVHVTGTKGKGSTSAMLAAVLRAAGYRVGLFTSPHLVHVEERTRIDGVPISHDELATNITTIAAAVRELDASPLPPPTFFEIGTALGFLHFVNRRVDVAIVEVGLGGRFDSTNVCSPLVSVITSIGLDHTPQLGTTLEAIAFQKAGIIKQRVPVVSGVTEPAPQAVIRRVAVECHAPLIERGRDFDSDYHPAKFVGESSQRRHPQVTVTTSQRRYPDFTMNLLGAHQASNAALVVATVEQLRKAGMPIPDAALATGFAEVRWPARIEVMSTRPVVILDTAHNVPSIDALLKTLAETFPEVRGRKSVVFAVSSDKQYPDMLRRLSSDFDRFHLCRFGSNPRSVPPEKLAELLHGFGVRDGVFVHSTASIAWQCALSEAGAEDLVCVTGSVFLAGEIRSVGYSDSPG